MFFRAHRTNDLTKKLEEVGPFECDELEEHCRVSAKCYPTKLPALCTMAKESSEIYFPNIRITLPRTLPLYCVLVPGGVFAGDARCNRSEDEQLASLDS